MSGVLKDCVFTQKLILYAIPNNFGEPQYALTTTLNMDSEGWIPVAEHIAHIQLPSPAELNALIKRSLLCILQSKKAKIVEQFTARLREVEDEIQQHLALPSPAQPLPKHSDSDLPF